MNKKDNDKTNEVLPAVPVPLADKLLTEEEDKFCELYVSGGPIYAGNHRKCYEEVFGKGKNVPIASRLLLGRPHISSRIREMIDSVQFDVETIATRLQVAETLKAVMSETSIGRVHRQIRRTSFPGTVACRSRQCRQSPHGALSHQMLAGDQTPHRRR